jgi:AcrR family transcriptional regulator
MSKEKKKRRQKTTRAAGRPRSEESRTSILAAAYKFLSKLPVHSISTLRIAKAAGVSTATIYRWWQTKEALLLDAFVNQVEMEIEPVQDGPPLVQLRLHIHQVGRFFSGENGIVVVRLLTAIQDNATLRKEFLKQVYSPRDKEIRGIVNAAIKNGDLPADLRVTVFLDSIVGPLLARLLFRQEKIDKEFVESVFRQGVAGAMAVENGKD